MRQILPRFPRAIQVRVRKVQDHCPLSLPGKGRFTRCSASPLTPMMGRPKPTPERTVTPAKASVSRMLDFEMPIREQPRPIPDGSSAREATLHALNGADVGVDNVPHVITLMARRRTSALRRAREAGKKYDAKLRSDQMLGVRCDALNKPIVRQEVDQK